MDDCRKQFVIARGTTPSFKVKFDTILPESMDVAYLIIRQQGKTIVSADMSQTFEEEDGITWTLTQQQTLLLNPGIEAEVFVDWKTAGGIRGQSKTLKCGVIPAGKNEVI